MVIVALHQIKRHRPVVPPFTVMWNVADMILDSAYYVYIIITTADNCAYEIDSVTAVKRLFFSCNTHYVEL